MKKRLLLLLLILVLVLVVAAVVLLRLIPRTEKTQETSVDVLSYAAEAYPEYTCTLDGGVLSLTKPLTLTYAQACDIGGSIYCDELAPETYLSSVQSIALDIAGHCGQTVTVRLVQESSDGKPVFTVASSGEITTCWAN